MKWLVETMAQVRRVYEVEALTAEDAEETLAYGDDAVLVCEEDISEDIDSVVLNPEKASNPEAQT